MFFDVLVSMCCHVHVKGNYHRIDCGCCMKLHKLFALQWFQVCLHTSDHNGCGSVVPHTQICTPPSHANFMMAHPTYRALNIFLFIVLPCFRCVSIGGMCDIALGAGCPAVDTTPFHK